MKSICVGLAVLLGCGQVSSTANAMNCVEYVKYATGLNLMGNAYQWWYSADHVLERGYQPAPGAIMVFDRTSRMHVGHVAVVREVRGSREILIDQANWHHGRVDHAVSVIDRSPDNDWSSVDVEWSPNVYGGPFPITGFIYTQGTPRGRDDGEGQFIEASTRGERLGSRLRGGRNSSQVRIYSGSGASHVSSGHLVMANLDRSKKPSFKFATMPTHTVLRSTASKTPAAANCNKKQSVKHEAISRKAAKAEAHATTHSGKSTKRIG